MKKLFTIVLFLIAVSSPQANMSVRLDKLYCLSPGDIVDLPILLENDYPAYQLGGFDFLIQYDDRLVFQLAQTGALLESCGWEYFSYSVPQAETIHIIALAELNNGNIHPSCYADQSGELVSLRFEIPANLNLVDEFLTAWWYWEDCGDNSLASKDGFTLYVSDSVYYYDGFNEYSVTQYSSPFPTPGGATDSCVTGVAPSPERMIDFYGGGFKVSQNGFKVQCISDIVAPADSGACGAVINYTIPTNSDCAGMYIQSNHPSGSFFPVGTTTVNVVARDNRGHVDYCSFLVTIEDTQIPEFITCPSDTTLIADPGVWWTQYFYSFSADDICSYATLTSNFPSGSYFALGVTEVFCIATDSSGNADSCSFNVTVLDREAPILNCPDSIVLNVENGTCGATAEFSLSATDNSKQVSLVSTLDSGTFLPVGTTVVDVSASDPYGNSDSCSFVILVQDLEAPQIDCIQDIIVSNDVGECGAMVEYSLSATDNCGEPQLTYSSSSGSFFPIGSTLVVVTATDESANIDSCQFYVIVEDIEPPQITAPNNIFMPTDFDQCGATVAYTYTASDNCNQFVVTKSVESNSFFEVGSTLVVLNIQDNAGLTASDSFMVVIEDRQSPIVVDLLDKNVMTDSGFYGAYVEYNPEITDNCQLESVVLNPISGSYFEVGTHPVSLVVTDIHGNIDSSSFNVNVTLQDIDNDLVADFEDNCMTVYNPNQENSNADKIGDACCCVGIRGNVDASLENMPEKNGIDISDLVMLVSLMFDNQSNIVLACPAEADFNADSLVDISDLVLLVSYIFESENSAPLPCY